jgi:hypothetical protein
MNVGNGRIRRNYLKRVGMFRPGMLTHSGAGSHPRPNRLRRDRWCLKDSSSAIAVIRPIASQGGRYGLLRSRWTTGYFE